MHPREWSVGEVLVWLRLAMLDTLRPTFKQHEVSGAVLFKFDEEQARALIAAHFSAQDEDDRDNKAESDLTAKLWLAITELRKEAQRREADGSSAAAEGGTEAEATAGSESEGEEDNEADTAGGTAAPLSLVGRVQQGLFVCFQYALLFWIYKMLSNSWAKWKG